MAWLLLLVLHVRAAWPGFTYNGFSDLAGFLAGQVFFVGVLLVLAVLARGFPKRSRWLALPAAALAIVLVFAGWLGRATGDTARSFGDESSQTRWGMLWSSAKSEADWPLAGDTLLALAAVAAFFFEKKRAAPVPRHLAVAGAAGLALMALGAAHKPADYRVESPLLAVLRSRAAAAVPITAAPLADAASLSRGSGSVESGLERSLQERRAAFGLPPGHRRNVVLLFLESTGYAQMLPRGEWDPALSPNIYALSRHGILFPTMYTVFPGTVRSHLAVMTGGKIITWGSEYKELSHSYLGPTLPGELKKRGYRTGFFSAAFLNSENMDGFYGLLPFDARFAPEHMAAEYQAKYMLNSWGLDDREVVAQALSWVDKGKGPFFLAINFDATHHPYSIPKDFQKFRPGDSDREHFDDALHFLDYAIGQLADGLRARGQGDTVILMMGDHGEAFGDLHPGNFTHRNFIYEENVHSFLLAADLNGRVGPLTAEPPIDHGAVLPTALEIVDQRRTPGSAFEPRAGVQYFFKNTHPEMWGLRDGPWKFISKMLEPASVELYRLDSDPHEQHNLAARYPDKARDYQKRVTQWYVYKEKEFADQLADYAFEGGEGLTAEDLKSPGPKRMAFGLTDAKGKFVPMKEVPQGAKITAWTQDVPYPQGRLLLYRWEGPDGAKRQFTFFHDPAWSDVYVYPQASFDMAPGEWKAWVFDGDKELVSGRFTVKK